MMHVIHADRKRGGIHTIPNPSQSYLELNTRKRGRISRSTSSKLHVSKTTAGTTGIVREAASSSTSQLHCCQVCPQQFYDEISFLDISMQRKQRAVHNFHTAHGLKMTYSFEVIEQGPTNTQEQINTHVDPTKKTQSFITNQLDKKDVLFLEKEEDENENNDIRKLGKHPKHPKQTQLQQRFLASKQTLQQKKGGKGGAPPAAAKKKKSSAAKKAPAAAKKSSAAKKSPAAAKKSSSAKKAPAAKKSGLESKIGAAAKSGVDAKVGAAATKSGVGAKVGDVAVGAGLLGVAAGAGAIGVASVSSKT
jgi:hypothetical protein